MEGIDIKSPAWFCLRTHLKQEHIAAAHLKQAPEIEVFLPRVRYLRTTRSGQAWVTEALFQNYLFARFDLNVALRRIQHSRGVRGVVHFGTRWPTIPQGIIKELKEAMNDQELRVLDNVLKEGDAVEITGGPMRGLEAVVTKVMPAKQRVAILLDFLGRQTTVEIQRAQVSCADYRECRGALFALDSFTTV
jgi:transcriptional antiterminator RfaH